MANTFNVGDTVVLITDRHGDSKSNPYSFSMDGEKVLGKVTVTNNDRAFNTSVKWATGSNNNYYHTDLQLATAYYNSIIANKKYKSIW